MSVTLTSLRQLALNGGQILSGDTLRLVLPPTPAGYADAQVDDYGWRARRVYPWRPGVRLEVTARFSDSAENLRGTAGFGFWNAPFGDPTTRWPALPQAAWFFFGSPPTDLPLAPAGPGQGWFAATLDAAAPAALALLPVSPLLALAQQWSPTRRRLWPWLQRRLGIHFQLLPGDMRAWHTYTLAWKPQSCRFLVDGETILTTDGAPRGPLGFVAWLDNQYLAVTPRGQMRSGVLATKHFQWLEISHLHIGRLADT